jgi:small membrane protein
MTLIQILLLIFFAFAALKAFVQFRSGDIRLLGFVYWLAFWVAAAGIVVWPDATFIIANKLGIGRGADLVVYVGLAILFFSVFRLMAGVERQKREFTELTRALALKENK